MHLNVYWHVYLYIFDSKKKYVFVLLFAIVYKFRTALQANYLPNDNF